VVVDHDDGIFVGDLKMKSCVKMFEKIFEWILNKIRVNFEYIRMDFE
jgi:hypothetical protein